MTNQNKSLINLNDYSGYLSHYRKDRNCYHCPVCDGKLSVSRGNGEKFTCYTSGCGHADIRKAVLALAGENTSYSQEFLDKREQRERARAEENRDRLAASKSELERNRDWRGIADQSSLSDRHRQDMLGRGWTDEQIVASNARSSARGRIIPITTAAGFMVGSQVITPEGKRWYGSEGTNKLKETGELPLAVVYPAAPRAGVIAHTESTLDKPHLTAHKLNLVTIGSSNIGSQSNDLKRSITTIKNRMGWDAVEHILMPDAGAVLNKGVLANYQKLQQQLEALGEKLQVRWWGQVAKSDGDIDEIDLNVTSNDISWDNFVAIAKHAQAVEASIFRGFGIPPKPRTLVEPKFDAVVNTEYTNPAELNAIIQTAVDTGIKAILDVSSTGSGKSTIAAEIRNITYTTITDGGVIIQPIKQYLNISNTHRNPTTSAVETNFTDVPSRNQQLYINPDRLTPNGNPHLQRTQPDGANWDTVIGNCHLADQHDKMRSKGYDIDSENNPICQVCPQLEACRSASGVGFGYLYERRTALMQERIRISPASLPSANIPEGVDVEKHLTWEDRIANWDDQKITIGNDIFAYERDFNATIAKIAIEDPELLGKIAPLIQKLDNLYKKEQKAYHGFSHHEILEGVEINDLEQILPDLIRILTPDFSAVVEEMNGINMDRMSPSERKSAQFANKILVQQTKRENYDRIDDLPSNWLLGTLIAIIAGKGNLRFENNRLIVSQPNNYHREICQQAKINIFLDATENVEDLMLKTGFTREQILVISQPLPDYSNLTITQVTGMGNPSKQRRDRQQTQIDALIDHLKSQNLKVEVIDKIRKEDTGLWYRDSRGTNQYENCDILIAIGAPVPNLGALAAEYSLLIGRQVSPTSKDADWVAYIQRHIQAETIQLIGRVRAQHRPDKQIQVYWVVDRDDLPLNEIVGAYPGCTFQHQAAIDICVAAATPAEQVRHKIAQALMSGKDWTLTQLAEHVERTKGRVSQLLTSLGDGGKKSLAVLVKALYSTTKLWDEKNPGGGKCPPSQLIDWANLVEPEMVDYASTILTNPAIAPSDLAAEVAAIATILTTQQLKGLFARIGKSLTDRFIDLLKIGISKFEIDPVPI